MAKARTKGRRGRPPRGEYPEKSEVMNFRIRPDTKRLLQKAAGASGRTLSGETEHQLRRALAEMGTGRTHAVMTAIGRSIDNLVKLKTSKAPGYEYEADRDARWWSDSYLFAQARDAVLAGLEMFRPADAAAAASNSGGARQGKFAVETTLREIQQVDENKPFVKQSAHERWLGMLKKDLGDLADRPVVWGKSAEEAREQQALGETLSDVLSEMLPLAQKAAKADAYRNPPEGIRDEDHAALAAHDLTSEETARLAELKKQLAAKLGRES